MTALAPPAVPAQMSRLVTSLNVEAFLRRLDWTVVRRLDGLLQGDYRSLFVGHGYDLAEVHEYQPEDDVRYMDWNVTARMTEPYVRQYIEARDLTAWLVLDVSPSVAFGTADMSKRELLSRFSGVVARLLTRRGNRVGAVLFGEGGDRVIEPRSSQAQVLRFLLDLSRQNHAGSPPQAASDLGPTLDRISSLLKRRSLVFVVSDFFLDTGWDRPLSRLAKKHEVVGVWLSDPREEELPPLGPLVFEDAETGEQVQVDTSDPGFRKRFKAAVESRQALVRRSFSRAAVDFLELDTGRDLADDLYRFIHLRREGRRRISKGVVGS